MLRVCGRVIYSFLKSAARIAFIVLTIYIIYMAVFQDSVVKTNIIPGIKRDFDQPIIKRQPKGKTKETLQLLQKSAEHIAQPTIRQQIEHVYLPNETTRKTVVPLLIYNRVPKCASTTMTWIVSKLKAKLGFKMIYHNWPHLKQVLSESEQEQLKNNITELVQNEQTIFIRHLHFMEFSNPDSSILPIYMNIIRHPVQRFISHFYYMRFGFHDTDSNSTWAKAMSNNTRLQTLEQCVAESPLNCVKHESTTMLAFFCGQSAKCRIRNDWTLQTAKKNVVTYYSLVGIVEDLPNTMKLLEHTMPSYFYGASNVYKQAKGIANETKTSQKTSQSNETLQKLTKAMKYEIQFYDFVRNRFYQQLSLLNAD